MKKAYLKPDMTVHVIKLGFICQSGAKMQSAKSNLGNDAIEYGGYSDENAR